MTVHISDAASATTQWLGVDWGSIAIVFVVALVATVVIVGSYSVGTRLLAIGVPDIQVQEGADPDGPDAIASPRQRPRPVAATIGAWTLYAVGAAATIYGIYLVIPLFHH